MALIGRMFPVIARFVVVAVLFIGFCQRITFRNIHRRRDNFESRGLIAGEETSNKIEDVVLSFAMRNVTAVLKHR